MNPDREIRYYASIPKFLLLLLVTGGLAFAGWKLMWIGIGGNLFAGGLLLLFCGFGALVSFAGLLLTIVVRKPILRINSAGIMSSLPIMPWRSTFVPWEDTERVSIQIERLNSSGAYRITYYYFIVEVRHPERYPSLASVAITVSLSQLRFLTTTRTWRESLLNRIQTHFAPEIIQYNVYVDKMERPIKRV